MKKLIYLLSFIILLSCASKKNNENNTQEYELSQKEKKIINDFITEEFSNKKYNNYKDYKIYLRRKGFSEIAALTIYGYCHQERNNRLRTANNKDWILDSLQLKTIKDTLKIKRFTWKETNVFNFKVSMINSEDIHNAIRSNDFEKYKNSLILSISIPVVIDDNSAFISYLCIKGSHGYSTIDNFAALLKKSQNGIWKIDSYYYDPNMSW